MKRWNAVFDGILNTLAAIAGVFIVLMTLIECYEVIARYFLKRPPIWGVEVCEYMLFLLGFLGTAWVLREKSHISVTILLDQMKPRIRACCNMFACSLGIVISLIIIWYSLKTSWQCYVTDVKVVKTLAQPKWIFLSFISLGYLLLLVELVRQFLAHVRSLGTGE
ncbi:MAG: TRAP transporter small permease subunit [Thermodesulfobacteriota bacterium]